MKNPPPSLQDLDDMLAAGEAEAAEAAAMPPDLDDLLAEAIADRDSEQEIRRARERVRKSGAGAPSAAERAADMRRIAEWDTKRNWRAVKNIAVWEKYKCACRSQHTIFRKVMQEQVHAQDRTAKRWVVVDEADPGLPTEIGVETWNTPYCTRCAPDFGIGFQDVRVRHFDSEQPE